MIFSKRIRMLAATALLAPNLSNPLMAQDQPDDVSNEELSESEIVELPEEGITLAAPKGWEILKDFAGQKVYLRAPKPEGKIDYDKPQFQRNITLAVNYEATPVDQKQFELIKAKMMKSFGEAPGVEAYTIGETPQFFDYKAENDGMIIEASFYQNGFAMSQVHVYVSNTEKNVLVTYTDLTDSFQTNPAAYDEAWASMTSVNLDGEATAGRYDALITKLLIFGPILLLLLVALLL